MLENLLLIITVLLSGYLKPELKIIKLLEFLKLFVKAGNGSLIMIIIIMVEFWLDGWNPSIWNVEILFVSSQVIYCKVQQLNSISIPFVLSVIYALNFIAERRLIWNDLSSLNKNLCWCLLGDFNEIKSLSETDRLDDSWDIGKDEFKKCTERLGVDDIRGLGPFFTWWNCQSERKIHRKLDRALGNLTGFHLSLMFRRFLPVEVVLAIPLLFLTWEFIVIALKSLFNSSISCYKWRASCIVLPLLGTTPFKGILSLSLLRN